MLSFLLQILQTQLEELQLELSVSSTVQSTKLLKEEMSLFWHHYLAEMIIVSYNGYKTAKTPQ